MDERITSYLPRILLDWYSHQARAKIHEFTEHRGILLFADTSGFTALTRALAAEGKVGFETLTGLLNRLFVLLEQVIVAHDGDILKFSGDAVWCYFPEGTIAESVFAQMLYQVDRLNREQPICVKHPLSLHAGAAAGTFTLISFGDPDARLEFEISGNTIGRVYQACDQATAGELAIWSPSSGEGRENGDPTSVGSCQIVKPQSEATAGGSEVRTQSSDISSAGLSSIIEKYLPQAVRERKQTGASDADLQSEHRQVTVLFANLLLPEGPPAASGNPLHADTDRAVAEIFRTIHHYGGIVARVDPFTRGHKLLALFGALSKSSSDKLNALQAAHDIVQLAAGRIAVKIGLAAGPLLCGEVGSNLRREYTVMGEAVNLAARLMSRAAESEILLDRSLQVDLSQFISTSERRLKLKGIGDEVVAHKFDSWSESKADLPQVRELVGRDEALTKLQELWSSRSAQSGQWACLEGEPGIGRTTLAAAFACRGLTDRTIYLSAYGARIHHPGWLIKKLLLSSPASGSPIPESLPSLRERAGTHWLPLLDQILGLPSTDNEWTRGLSADLRLEKQADLVQEVLADRLQNRLVILDDLETVDSLTSSILARLVTNSDLPEAMLILIADTVSWLSDAMPLHRMKLTGLDDESLKNWLSQQFVAGPREVELEDLLLTRSQGNPLFVQESLEQLATAGAIGHLTNVNKWEVLRPLDEIKLADRLEDLQLAQFDALPESQRRLLKVASAFDGEFSVAQLTEVVRDSDRISVEKMLGDLVESGFLKSDPLRQRFAFDREITRQAIYNCIPRSELDRLHRLIGELLSRQQPEPDVMRLAYHFSRADDPARAFEYSLRAAEEARSRRLLVEASQYFRKCDQLLLVVRETAIDSRQQLSFYRRMTEFSINEGNYDDVYRLARKWRRLGRRMSQPHEYHAAANQLAKVLWKQAKYGRCRQVLERLVASPINDLSNALLAETYSLFGELYRRTGKLAEAQAAGQKAIELAQSGVDRAGESDACNNLGLAYWAAGKLSEAGRCFDHSLQLRREIGSKHSEARVDNNLAIIAEEMGDYVGARRLARQARDIFTEIGDRRNQAYAGGNLANLLMQSGRYREAEELFRSADRIFVRLGENHPHQYTIGNLGDLDLLLGRFDEADTKYREVAKFALECGDEELQAEMAVRFAELAYYGSQRQTSRGLYEDAIRMAETVGSQEYQIRGTIGLCRYLIGEKDTLEAQAVIERLSQFATETHSDRIRFEAEFLNGELKRIAGSDQLALPHYRACTEYATAQEQFELALKSRVRIYETHPQDREQSAIALRSLLDNFRIANGEPALSELLQSRYFKFFHNTLRQALAPTSIEFAR